MFKSLRERLSGWKEKAEAEVTSESIGDSGRKIKEDKLEEILYDLEIALLESDVAFPVAKEIVNRLADDLQGKRIARDVSLEKGVEGALRDAITKALSVPPLDFFGLLEKSPRPFVVMFVGVFFFQAEDGIRDLTVTGVQTCALPISSSFQCRYDRPGRCFESQNSNRPSYGCPRIGGCRNGT